MNDNFSNSQITRKSIVANKAGVVSAQHRRAAEVGAAVLDCENYLACPVLEA